MAVPVEQIGKAIVAATLMSADDLKAVWASVPVTERPKGGDTFAQLLVQKGGLLSFNRRIF